MGKRNIKVIRNGEEKMYSKDFLYSDHGQEFLGRLYLKKDDIDIMCMCKTKGVPMHLAKYGNGRYYAIRTNQKQVHDKKCENYTSKGEKEKNRERYKKNKHSAYNYVDESGRVYSHFNNNDFYRNDTSHNTTNTSKKTKSYNDNRYTKIFSMGERLLSNSWKNTIKEINRLPKEGNILYSLYNSLDKYTFNKGITLEDFMFHPTYSLKDGEENSIEELIKKSYYSVHLKNKELGYENANLFILAKLVQDEDKNIQFKEDDNNNLCIEVIEPFKKGKFRVWCDKDRFTRELNKRIMPKAEYYLSSYVNVSKDNITLYQFAIIPVLPERGFYVESSKEIEFADYLIDREILFERPPKSCNDFADKWDGKIPDFLFLDYDKKEVTTIAEVFGFKDEEYMKNMEKKIEYFTMLKEEGEHGFVYWKANCDYPMPELEKKTGKFIGLQKNKEEKK